ncbi:MAG: minor capsid protein [Acidobacteria bacterium]|nr:minor capsid protein [Acidobacteriota bacterium]
MEKLAKKLRDFLVRAEKGTALLLNYEFDELQKEIADHIEANPADIEYLEEILNEIEKLLARRTVRFAAAVENAQKRVVRSTADTLKAELHTSVFKPDKPAIKKLIGRTQTGTSLTKFFKRLEPAVREAAKDALIEGFSLGESSDKIARRLNDVTDIGKFHAMTIARTETNEAFRAASRDFYNDAGIKRYVWMSARDPRTCLICWRLHGTIWPTAQKVSAHPRCRCTVIPLLDGQPAPETGEELFAKLEPGYQKQILGPARFELYKAGYRLSDFVGSEDSEEFGTRHFIRNLNDLHQASGSRAKGYFFVNEKIYPYKPKGAIFGQSDKYSCVPCSVRMILNDHGQDIPEAFLREELGTNKDGTPLSRAAVLLNEQVPDKQFVFKRKAIIDDLLLEPSIVNVRTPVDIHSVVVDRIDSNKVYLRDSLPESVGKAYAIDIDVFKKYWLISGKDYGLAVIIKQDD